MMADLIETEASKKKTHPLGRNWTKEETELFAKLLSDVETDYISKLEEKAIKRKPNTDLFMEIMEVFTAALNQEEFKVNNIKANFMADGRVWGYYEPLIFNGKEGVIKLTNKYKRLKTKWRKYDSKPVCGLQNQSKQATGLRIESKPSSGLQGGFNDKCRKSLNPISSERKAQLDEVVNESNCTLYLEEDGGNNEYSYNDIASEGSDEDVSGNDDSGHPVGKTNDNNGSGNPVGKTNDNGSCPHLANIIASGLKAFAESQTTIHEKDIEENRRRDEISLKFQQEENQRDREHEMKLMKMMLDFQRENPTNQIPLFTKPTNQMPQFTKPTNEPSLCTCSSKVGSPSTSSTCSTSTVNTVDTDT